MGSVSKHPLKELGKYKQHDHLHHALLLAFKALKVLRVFMSLLALSFFFFYTVEESLLLLLPFWSDCMHFEGNSFFSKAAFGVSFTKIYFF